MMTQTYTYFVQAKKTGLIKIGRAVDVEKRLKPLQQGSPDVLTLLGTVPESLHDEESVHKRFIQERTHSEWFKPSSRLLKFIKKNATQPVKPVVSVLPAGTRLRTPGNLGNLIKGYRVASGLNQADLAEQAGVSRQWVIEAEKGKVRAEIGLIFRILNVLNIPLGIVEKEPEQPSIVDMVLERCKGKKGE